MISLGSSDARKGLGLGLGGGGKEMEDTELEEGEACSYNNNNNDYDDASVDPDIALSYIGEKVQDVLGHFQKDFEGGVSAENLGAKFGGYGSFLPTYQRSPVWSHPRTSPKAQSHAVKSPNNLQVEGGHPHMAFMSSIPQSVGPASVTGGTLPVSKALFMNDLVKQEVSIPSNRADEFSIKKCANLPDQKTLKLRIKVGSDNLTQKNAAIYSGLGLDVSPSSSMDNSPSENEGMYHDSQDVSFESPTNILRVMTSFPVLGDILLSPLPDNVLYLTKMERILKDNRSDSGQNGGIFLGDKRAKSVERNDFPAERRGANNGDIWNENRRSPKKEVDDDSFTCEELVSKTLKLPLLSNPYSAVDKVNKKGIVHNEVKDESFEPVFTQEIGRENLKSDSEGNVWEDKKTNFPDDLSCYPSKDSCVKGEKSYDIGSIDPNSSKGKKALNKEQVDDHKEKVSQRAISNEQESMKLPQGKEHASSGAQRKSKGNQSHGNVAADVLKESLRSGGSSLMPKSKKNSHVDNNITKREMGDLNLEKPFKKVEDRYRDLFGDMEESEQEENQTTLVGIFSEHRLKETEKIDKSRPAINNTSKDRLSNEKSNKLLAPEPYPKLTGDTNLHPRNVNISETAPATAAPLLIEEWVCCDKCQKWRLLPFGMNVASLPDKWLCSMLTWLPGMNRCSFSEEETTRALIALYQVPAVDNQINLNSNIGNNISRTQAADIQHPYQNHRSNGSHSMPSGGKKKHGLKEISNFTEKDGPTQLSNSMKKIVQASDRTGSLNDVSQPPVVGEPGFWNLSKSCDLPAEKHRNNKKEKHKVPGHSSDGGGAKNLKMKGKSHADQDCFRASKKIKSQNLDFTDDDRVSDHAGAVDKVVSGSNCGLPTTSVGKDKPKHNESFSYKDSKVDKKERPRVSVKGLKDRVPPPADDGSVDLAKHGGDFSLKRKINEHDGHVYSGSFQGKVLENEEFSGNDCRKEKKVRASKSESKDSGASKINGNRKGSHSKNHQKGQDKGGTLSRGSLDGTDTLKRDFGPAQPSAAATSSSSKVSGSHKSKPGFQEPKGSPVESVSSSPMRMSNPDKFPLARRNISMRDESRDTEHFSTRSPRRYSNGDDNVGRDRSKTGRKEKTFAAQNRFHEASVLDFQDKDASYLSGGQAKLLIAPSHDTNKGQFTNGCVDYLGQETQYPCKSKTIDQHHNEERQNDSNHFNANGSHPRKSGKGSLHSKEKNQNFKPDSSELQDSAPELQDSVPLSEGKPRDGNKFQEKFGIKSNQTENRYAEKKESVGKFSSENGKRDSQANLLGHEGPDAKVDATPDAKVDATPDAKVDATCSQDAMPNVKQSLIQDSDGERCKERLHPDKTDQVEVVSGRGNPLSLPPSGNVYPVSGSKKGRGGDSSGINASQGDDVSKVPRQINKADYPNGTQNISIRQPSPGGHRIRDPNAPGSLRKHSSSQAANNAMKEATDLKHLADRLKSTGDVLESTGLYFRAALKFLHGASLLESCTSESAKNVDSLQVYSSTAKLCEYCAHEYEKRKEMAPAALAYKCMEVAYMKVVYSSHSCARGYRNELQAALHIVPPGESPSSSASDVDNLNHPTAVDKVSFPKGVSSPQVAGSMVISARDRPSFVGLLNFAKDVNHAMEASRKSQLAFAAARSGEAKSEEIVSSVKSALDFNFQDIERLLHLIRVAMEAISP